MRQKVLFIGIFIILALTSSRAFSAYHHMGEKDSDKFLAVYPEQGRNKTRPLCFMSQRRALRKKRPAGKPWKLSMVPLFLWV